MKRRHVIFLGILTACLVSLAVICLLQLQKAASIKEEVVSLQKEVNELKTSVEEKEKENKSLEDEKTEIEDKLKELEEIQKKEEQAKKEEAEKKEAAKKGKKIAIDPGHQGYNIDMSAKEPLGPGSSQMKAKATSGTKGRFTGVPEFELNLNISKQLQEELEKRGYEVMLTRQDNDTAISNKERALLAADFGADIYVRIHANGSESSSTSGAMTMVPSSKNPFVPQLHEKSYALGKAVIDAYSQSCGIKNNGVQLFDNMTGINWSTVPVIILEMGFMTNENDDKNMQKPEVQTLMVQGIANGIDAYFEAGN